MGRVAFAAGKTDDPHILGIDGTFMDVAENGFPMLRMDREQAESEHAVGFAAAHALAEDEDALVAFACKSAEAVAEKLLQTIGEVVLSEELLRIDLAIQQVGEIQDGVAA